MQHFASRHKPSSTALSTFGTLSDNKCPQRSSKIYGIWKSFKIRRAFYLMYLFLIWANGKVYNQRYKKTKKNTKVTGFTSS